MKAAALGKNLVNKLISSLKRFPEAIALATCATLLLIVMNHLGSYRNDYIETLRRVSMVLALGIPLSLCVKVFWERRPGTAKNIRIAVYALSIAGLLLYYFYLLPGFNMVPLSRYTAFSLCLYCIFTFIPYFYRRDNYEHYVIDLLKQFLITFIYAVVLFAGLAAMLFTVDRLLFSVPEKLYLDIWLLVAGIFSPAYFLSGIPAAEQEFAIESYPKVLRVLLLYIVMPIISAYTLILYIYFAKILITRQWPGGLVSHLVLWYSLISTFVVFLIYPLRGTIQWVRVFLAVLPKLILPLLAMMFVSMGIRINAYGITENRYLVILGGLWVMGYMIYFILSRKPRNIVAAISLAVIAALAVAGPWSCYSVSKMSQNVRFEKILQQNGMLQGTAIIKPFDAPNAEDRREISSILSYFERYHGLEKLKYLPPGFQMNQMKDVFGFEFEYGFSGGGSQYFVHHLEEDGISVNISGYDYFFVVNYGQLDAHGTLEDDIDITYTPDNKEFRVVRQGQTVYGRSIADIAVEVHERNRGKSSVNQEDMTFFEENGDIRVLYIFRHIRGREGNAPEETKIDPPEVYEVYIFVELLK